MSFDFTFDKRTAPLMAGCVILACLLIFFAGLLLGLRNGSSGGNGLATAGTSHPALLSTPGIGKSSAPAGAMQNQKSATNLQSSNQQSAVAGESYATSTKPAHEARAYCLQFGSFQKKANAAGLLKKLKKKHVAAEIIMLRSQNKREWYVVRAGKYSSIDVAAAQSAAIKRKTDVSSLVRRTGSI
jgi:cell division septation protein DedD